MAEAGPSQRGEAGGGAEHVLQQAEGAGGLTVSPGLDSVVRTAHVGPGERAVLDRRVLWIGAVALVLGVVAALAAQVLVALIALITNVSFYGKWSFDHSSPAGNHLGLWVILVPMAGGLVIGLMARFGSRAIRGHGIPETMEKVLAEESRIPPRVTLLKPLSAAVSIGTGGPFGAEGPIIATGAALGSLLGQLHSVTPAERKTLLAAGAAAGMSATFGAPFSAVLLAVELLLFELRPRSVIPVALATTAAAGMRIVFEGAHPAFEMPDVGSPTGAALALYVLIGAVMGVASVAVTRIAYGIEDLFERLPIHWMWWPVIGTAAVGVCGYFAPRTLGVGYDVITDMLQGRFLLAAVAWLCAMKFISWAVSLGSGTSGGTLAPLFTIGGGLGTLLGAAAMAAAPAAGVDIRVAALVGMAALFAGASRALLTASVFAFEVTLQPTGLLPLLGACAAAYLVSTLLMRESIMTEKLARRGLRVPAEYHADPMDHLWVKDVAAKEPVTLRASQTLGEVRAWIAAGAPGSSHTGFPVMGDEGYLVGVLTRRDILAGAAHAAPDSGTIGSLIRRPPVVVYHDCTLRDAVDHMVRHDVGRLPVVLRDDPAKVVGIITRSNVLSAHRSRVAASEPGAATIRIGRRVRGLFR